MKPVDDDLVVLCTVLPSQGYRSLANESVANHQQILKIELIFPIKQFLLEFLQNIKHLSHDLIHGLWTPSEEITFTARPKINSHSQIITYTNHKANPTLLSRQLD